MVSVYFLPRKYPHLTLYFQAQDRRSGLAHPFPSLRAPIPTLTPQMLLPPPAAQPFGVTSPCRTLLSVSTALTFPSTRPGLAFPEAFLASDH